MRATLFVMAFAAACGGSVKPAVIPTLSSLPADPQTRDHIVDSAMAQPTEEQMPATVQGRRIETHAATAAAILGMIFSHDNNVSFGLRVDEGDVGDTRPLPAPVVPDRDAALLDHEQRHVLAPPAGGLVPWIRVAPTP